MNTNSGTLSKLKLERPSWEQFIVRIRFCFWRLKTNFHLKIWQILYDRFNYDFDNAEGEDTDDFACTSEERKSIAEEVDKRVKDYIAARPHIEPRRTVLIYAKDNEHSCNFITARKYEKYVLHLYEQARSWGMSTFIVDHASPFGLLAYETLLMLREHGEKFNLYIFQSKVLQKCRSFRLVPETEPERIILTMNADYFYRSYIRDGIFDYFTRYAGVIYTENRAYVSREHIPDYLLEAWEVSL